MQAEQVRGGSGARTVGRVLGPAFVERQHLREPHWYLEACDRDGMPAYPDTCGPRNGSPHERLRFVRDEPLPVPAGCPVMVPVRREPR